MQLDGEGEWIRALAQLAVAQRVHRTDEPLPPEDLEADAVDACRRRDDDERPRRIGHRVRDGAVARVDEGDVQAAEGRTALRVARDAALGGRLRGEDARGEEEERRRGDRATDCGTWRAREGDGGRRSLTVHAGTTKVNRLRRVSAGQLPARQRPRLARVAREVGLQRVDRHRLVEPFGEEGDQQLRRQLAVQVQRDVRREVEARPRGAEPARLDALVQRPQRAVRIERAGRRSASA